MDGDEGCIFRFFQRVSLHQSGEVFDRNGCDGHGDFIQRELTASVYFRAFQTIFDGKVLPKNEFVREWKKGRTAFEAWSIPLIRQHYQKSRMADNFIQSRVDLWKSWLKKMF